MKKNKHNAYNELRTARNKLGLTQQAFAEQLGVARTTISNAEMNQPRPWMVLACIGLSTLNILNADIKHLSGETFAQLRGRLQVTPAVLALRLGMAESTIVTWERRGPPLWAYPAMVALASVHMIQ